MASVLGLSLLLASSVAAVDGVVQFDLTRGVRHSSGKSYAERLSRRASGSSDPVDLENELTFYSVQLEIGSQNQKVTAQIDTGSSDLWVMDSSNPLCSSISTQSYSNAQQSESQQSSTNSDEIMCYSEFIFNSSKSSTFQSNHTDFSITYGDYSFANGSYCHDNIVLGSDTVKNANFALATKANSSQAVFGIGMVTTEAIAKIDQNGNAQDSYPNIPQQMKDQGLIDRVAYSLWLNDINAADGSLLFGGVDHDKYTGQLGLVPLISAYSGINVAVDLSVMVNGISVYDKHNNSESVAQFALPFLLDSGTTFTRMPEVLLDPIIQSIGGVYSNRLGYYVAECSGPYSGGGVSFDFSGIQIQVPFSEILIPVGATDRSGREICLVGMLPDDSSAILGDTFLRSAYVVYDLESKEVALANVVYNATSSNVESIGSSIPSATQAPSYSSTLPQTSFSTGAATLFASGGSGGSSLSEQATEFGSLSGIQPTSINFGTQTGVFETSFTGVVLTASATSSSSSKSKNVGNNAIPNRMGGIAGTILCMIMALV